MDHPARFRAVNTYLLIITSSFTLLRSCYYRSRVTLPPWLLHHPFHYSTPGFLLRSLLRLCISRFITPLRVISSDSVPHTVTTCLPLVHAHTFGSCLIYVSIYHHLLLRTGSFTYCVVVLQLPFALLTSVGLLVPFPVHTTHLLLQLRLVVDYVVAHDYCRLFYPRFVLPYTTATFAVDYAVHRSPSVRYQFPHIYHRYIRTLLWFFIRLRCCIPFVLYFVLHCSTTTIDSVCLYLLIRCFVAFCLAGCWFYVLLRCSVHWILILITLCCTFFHHLCYHPVVLCLHRYLLLLLFYCRCSTTTFVIVPNCKILILFNTFLTIYPTYFTLLHCIMRWFCVCYVIRCCCITVRSCLYVRYPFILHYIPFVDSFYCWFTLRSCCVGYIQHVGIFFTVATYILRCVPDSFLFLIMCIAWRAPLLPVFCCLCLCCLALLYWRFSYYHNHPCCCVLCVP